ncbi:hypothetical protein GCM10027355_12610 [Haloplanus salinarum]
MNGSPVSDSDGRVPGAALVRVSRTGELEPTTSRVDVSDGGGDEWPIRRRHASPRTAKYRVVGTK